MDALFRIQYGKSRHLHLCKSEVCCYSLKKRGSFRLWDMQALQGDIAVKEDALGKGAQTHQLLQAETDRLRTAYEQERDTAHLLQQDNTAVISKLNSKEQVRLIVSLDHCIA